MEAKAHALIWTFVIATLAWPMGASADPPAESVEFGVKDARARFQRGVEFYLEGSYDAALAELTKAYQSFPNYRVLYNLAQVQDLRHDYVAALKLFEDYLSEGGSDIAADRREQVEATLAELKTRVARISVAGTPGSELLIDDEPAGRIPTTAPLLVNPGKHRLQLRKPGYETLAHQLTIASAEMVRLDLPLQPVPQAIAPHVAERAATGRGDRAEPFPFTAARSRGGSSSNAPMWISLIATSALAGGAITFGLLAKHADDDLGHALARVPANRSNVDDVRGRVERNAALCDGLAAGAVVGAGLFFYFAFAGSNSEEANPNAGTVVAGPTGLGLIERF